MKKYRLFILGKSVILIKRASKTEMDKILKTVSKHYTNNFIIVSPC